MNLLQQLQAANAVAPACTRQVCGRPIVPGSNRQRVLEWMDGQEGEFTSSQCAAAVGITGTQASVVLHDLERKSGMVTKTFRNGANWWRVV